MIPSTIMISYLKEIYVIKLIHVIAIFLKLQVKTVQNFQQTTIHFKKHTTIKEKVNKNYHH